MTNTRKQDVDNTLKNHDKAISEIQAALSALMKQQEQSAKQQEQILKAVQDKSGQGSGAGMDDTMSLVNKVNGGANDTMSLVNTWNGRLYSQRYYDILEKRKTLPVWHQKLR